MTSITSATRGSTRTGFTYGAAGGRGINAAISIYAGLVDRAVGRYAGVVSTTTSRGQRNSLSVPTATGYATTP